MHGVRTLVAAALGMVVLGAVGASAASASQPLRPRSGCPLPAFGPGRAYRPHIEPGRFSARVNNPLFPLPVGKTFVYAGTKDGKKALDLVHPSARTALIDGVRTRVVEDRLFLNGVLEERTNDYYAQDDCGNVWYFGEDTATLGPRGHVISTEGSFHAGVRGAQPGVYMQAHPQVGRWFRQEWYAGQAEDRFRALNMSAHVTVPIGTFRHALRTAERTALEPEALDAKWYVAGIGQVEELAVKGPLEKLVLIEVLG